MVQEAIKNDGMSVEKKLTTKNTADVLTKHLTAETFWFHSSQMGFTLGGMALGLSKVTT